MRLNEISNGVKKIILVLAAFLLLGGACTLQFGSGQPQKTNNKVSSIDNCWSNCLETIFATSSKAAAAACERQCGARVSDNSSTAKNFLACDYKNYSGRGVSSGCVNTNERCYNGTKTPCGPGDDCAVLPLAGDNKCHPICQSNADCPAGTSCQAAQYFTGDVINDYKFCVVN